MVIKPQYAIKKKDALQWVILRAVTTEATETEDKKVVVSPMGYYPRLGQAAKAVLELVIKDNHPLIANFEDFSKNIDVAMDKVNTIINKAAGSL